MNNNVRLIVMCFVIGFARLANANPDTSSSPGLNAYAFGINWLNPDHSLHGGTWVQVMDSVLGFNTHHVGGAWNPGSTVDTTSNVPYWSMHSKSKLIATNSNSVIDKYAYAERMRYEAIPSTEFTSPELLKVFTFNGRNTTRGDSTETRGAEKYWTVLWDSTHVNADDTVLSHNQRSWYSLNRLFRGMLD